MYQITDSTLKYGVYSALAAQTREFRQRLSFGEGTGANFLKQISFEKGITKIEISQEGNSDSSGLVFGSCCASSCVAEFYNPDKTYNYNGKTLFVECGIKYPVEITCGDVKNGYYNTDGVWEDSDIHYSISTNIFFVSEGDKFVYKGRGELGVASVIWYDSQMNFLSSEEYASETDNRVTTVTVEAPNKAAYARFQSFNFGSPYITFYVTKENESFFYIPCGYYKVDKPETDDDWRTVKVTAYDAVDDMTDKWNTSITFPSNAYILLQLIANKHNLELDIESDVLAELQGRAVTEEEALTLTAYTEREVCGFLAGLVGANARVNTVGKFAVRRYQYSPTDDFNIPANIQWQNGFKKTAEEEFMIYSVTSGIDDAVFTAGTGAGISFANPIITEDEITSIYGLYAGISFQPSSCEWRGNPCVECGDTVTVTDKNGNSYTVFAASQDIDLTGGLSMHTHCPGGDADISFDTVDERTRAALNRQYTALQQKIIEASNAINGALGGHYEILDSDSDGNPDGWLIKQNQDGTGGLIRANYAGIGLSNDGGVTYRTAITYDGINADCINAGKVKAEFIDTENLLVGTSNVDGLDDELEALLEATETANTNASNALSTANTASLNASSALSVANTVNGVIANWCYNNDTTVINGAKIYTGTITAKQIASESITADKLSVGMAERENLFYNPEFTENYTDDGTTYAEGWTAFGGTIEPKDGWIIFRPTSSSTNAGFSQKVWLKPGVYSIVAQLNLYNISSVGTNARIGYRFGATYGYDTTSQNIGNSSAVGQNKEMNVKYVYNYTGNEGFVDVGLYFRDMVFGGYITVAWMALFNADEEQLGANFYCSDSSWLKSAYKTSHLLTYSTNINSFVNDINAFTVDDNGELDVLGGTIGCLKFKRLGLNIESHVSDSIFGLTYDGYLEISRPSGAFVLGNIADFNDGVSASKAVAPSLDINDGNNNRSFVGLYGYYCADGTYTTIVRPRKIETTGTMEATAFNDTSREKHKQNIELKSSVLDKIKGSRIYEYLYKQDGKSAKRKTGFIVERETPEDVISDDGNGINLYSMASMNWKATQELLERLEVVEKEVKTNA